MYTEYHKEYSPSMGHDMEFKVYGHGGKPVLVIPCQNGRFYDWEGFDMMNVLGDYLEQGRLQLFCVDTVDSETVSAVGGDAYHRIRRHEAWFSYVVNEVVPRMMEINGTGMKPMVTGFSMGAYHAGNFYFRRPDVFDSLIALSGLYDTDDMYGGYMDELVYTNDPCASLSNLPADHPWRELYAQNRAVICVGQGAWEDQLLAGTRRLKQVCESNNIPVWIDIWGYDVNHDWDWWKVQIRYFLPYVLGEQ